ncbi:MAG: ABC transporter substrate-binding protein, partial [Chloroflexota bacterium]
MKRSWHGILTMAAAGLLLAACGGGTAATSAGASAASSSAGAAPASSAASPAASGGAVPSSVVIATQPGIGYAPLIVMQEKGWLEKALPKTKFSYKVLTSGAAIRDGMIAGQIQIGSGGAAPFLIGWDKGVKWRLMGAMENMPLWLNVMDPKIKNLKAFQGHPQMKIAMPAPDSIQAVVLMKASQTQLNDAKALVPNIVAMAHPLGVQALLSKQIAGHLTSPPFQ